MDAIIKFVGMSSSPSGLENYSSVSPANVGILGMELYFPKHFICQKDLEQADNVGAGKYTIGLGQSEMSFCDDSEDVCSLALSVTSALLKHYRINPNSIGFLEVGTETLIDKSKSVKTVLMDLFGENSDIQGADVKNACFGGTQALFDAVDWIYSNYEFEERLAIVVCVDIAIYSPGPARCTGGAGAIAFLVGPNAPIVLEQGLRGCFAKNVYDFYKPISGFSSEYAVVNGQKSVELYLTALDKTYEIYQQKCLKNLGKTRTVADFRAVLFHSPFTKLAQKAFARLSFDDFRRDGSFKIQSKELEKYRTATFTETLTRDFNTAAMKSCETSMEEKLNSNLQFNRRLGNMYTPSLYAQLVNLMYNNSNPNSLHGQRILLFSYGSGCIAAMFSIVIDTSNASLKESYEQMFQSAKQAHQKLDQRVKYCHKEFLQALELREKLISTKGPYVPCFENSVFFPDAYFLTHIDNGCRFYSKTHAV